MRGRWVRRPSHDMKRTVRQKCRIERQVRNQEHSGPVGRPEARKENAFEGGDTRSDD